MDKFETRLHNLIEKEIRHRVRNYAKVFDRTDSENRQLNQELYKREEEIASLEKELKTAQKLSIQGLTGGFDVGYPIWFARNKETNKVCERCNGSHEVIAIINDESEKIKCPSCNYGYHTSWALVPKKDYVRFITITISKQENYLSFRLDEADYDIDENKVFKSEEECQKYCDEINAKNR